MRRLTLLPLLAVALAGCGGSSGAPLSAAEFRQKADAVCSKVAKDLDAIPQPASPADLGAYVDKAKPVFENALEDLEDLNPPRALQAAANRWNEKNRETLGALVAMKDAKGTKLQQKADEFQRLTGEANRIASKGLGLDACAGDE